MVTNQSITLADPDLAYCHEAIRGVSRTFALTVDQLDAPMDDYISVGYLLCRVADTIEDASHIPTETQRSLLRRFDAALDPTDETTIRAFDEAVDEWLPPEGERNDDWRVVSRTPTVFATFASFEASTQAAIRPSVREMVVGMETFLERYADRPGIRIQQYAELERYSHFVAGTVGTLITNLLGGAAVAPDRLRTMERTAEGFGRLLQLVNIAKDVGADAVAEDNVYLPAEWLHEEGVDPDEILDPSNEEGVGRVIERVVGRARGYLDDGLAYLEAMPLRSGNTLAAWAVPYLLAVGTLRELERRPRDALTSTGVKITRNEVFAVLEAASSMRREDIASLQATISREPLHETDG
ncbi:MAG: phytoene/squalene synthase family protein [Halobacteriota archaeon]